MPAWLLKLILEYAISFLIKKLGIEDATVHIVSTIGKYAPPAPEDSPPMLVRNNPSLSNPPERGGIPR